MSAAGTRFRPKGSVTTATKEVDDVPFSVETAEPGRKLAREFYECGDVTQAARALLGKVLCSRVGGTLTSGVIVETEAYCGRDDRACHANDGVRTARTEVMYGPPGHAYVYLCYGIHHLFNVVTNRTGMADAVLVRAIRPLDGLQTIAARRGRKAEAPGTTDGPGKLTGALAITTGDSGADLTGERIWIEDRGIEFPGRTIRATPRIGVEYAGEHALRPWRFLAPDGL